MVYTEACFIVKKGKKRKSNLYRASKLSYVSSLRKFPIRSRHSKPGLYLSLLGPCLWWWWTERGYSWGQKEFGEEREREGKARGDLAESQGHLQVYE